MKLLYEIEYSKTALRHIRKIPKQDLERILTKIESLALEPLPKSSRKLAGHDNKYRVRQGNYRVVYSPVDDVLVIFVIDVNHRKDIYRSR